MLLVVNILFVPRYGYMACAWGGVAGYGVAMVTSYVVGQKYYPLAYPLKDIGLYVVLAVILTMAMFKVHEGQSMWLSLSVNTLLIAVFVAVIIKRDMPLSGLPVIGKYFRK